MSAVTRRIYQFGPFALDANNRLLSRDGAAVPCGVKPFDLLALLLSNAGNLVTRDDIQKALWPNRTIEYDQAINGAVREIRLLLGDNVSNPTYIKTLPKHGYVFIGSVGKCAGVPRHDSGSRWPAYALTVGALATAFWLAFVTLNSRKSAEIEQHSPTPKALAAYIKGQDLYEKHDPFDLGEVESLFRYAIEADNRYALAWAGLADVLYYTVEDRRKHTDESKAAAETALSLEPNLARALHRRAEILFTYDWSHEEAGKEFERALLIAPGDVRLRHSYSAFLLAQGKNDQAIDELKTALSIDPLSAVMTSDLAWTLSLANRHQEAIDKCKILMDLAADNPRSIACALRPRLSLGQIHEAADIAGNLLRRGGVKVVAIEPADVLVEFWQWRAQIAKEPVAVAIARARLGDALGALEALEVAHAERSRLVPFVHLYPEFRSLRTQPRFKAVAQYSELNTPHY